MITPLWTFDDFLAATKGRPFGIKPEVVAGISIDSRTIGRGEAFFAIQGEKFDGHDFTTRALAGGAVTAVVAEDRLTSMGRVSGSLTVVSDVLGSLCDLGLAARARSDASIVAITGSVGKTGTKEMLAQALAPSGAVHFSPASFNNHWGVPLSLSRLPVEARYAVFEIGMNHSGEIEPLVKMVRPHVAIITTVEPVHLEYFEDVDAIARAKSEIFYGLEPGGTAIINRDNPHYATLAAVAQATGVGTIIGFGAHEKSEAKLEKVVLKEDCSCVSAMILGEPVSYKLGSPGRHLVQNSLAVLAAVSAAGGDLAKAALSLSSTVASKGRGSRHRLHIDGDHEAVLIDESYNANPASMQAAISLLGQLTLGAGGRRIAVLGDMRELGPDAPALHAELAKNLVEAKVDCIFLGGPLMASLRNALPLHSLGGYAESTSELESLLFDAIAPGDVIMVKGSNASRMGVLVEAMKTRFADRREQSNQRQGQEIA